MVADAKITSAEELLAQINGTDGYECLKNPIVSARAQTPPPPEVSGLAPAGAYDATCGYTPLEHYKLAQVFVQGLGPAANIPNMKSAFNPKVEPASPNPAIDWKMS